MAETAPATAAEPQASAPPVSPTDHPLPADEPTTAEMPSAEVSAPVVAGELPAEPARDSQLDLDDKTDEPVVEREGSHRGNGD